MSLIKVTVLKPHSNAYGDAHEKPVDADYECPADVAQLLAEEGLVKLAEAPAAPAAKASGSKAG